MMDTRELEERFRAYLRAEGAGPGDRVLPELELVRRFGVSRGEIRKVLTSMCRSGILERHPRVGTVIRDLDPAQISDDLAFRFELAGLDPADAQEARLTVELAILPLVIRRMTPSTMSRLHELNEMMEESAGEPKVADQLDRDFHLCLLESCGNETLRAFAGVIAGLFHPDHREQWLKEKHVKRAVKEHRQLLDAIREEDLERASSVVSKSLTRT